jgi:hypothetical protein
VDYIEASLSECHRDLAKRDCANRAIGEEKCPFI